MGWNGANTYGVRVDSARVADSASSAGSATTATALSTAGGSAPSYSARAWVNFNGSGGASIRASGNVTSVTYNGTGDYTVNFSTAMQDANYSIVVSAMRALSGNEAMIAGPAFAGNFAAGSCRVTTSSDSGAKGDGSYVCVAVFR